LPRHPRRGAPSVALLAAGAAVAALADGYEQLATQLERSVGGSPCVTQRSFGGLRWRITAEIGIVRRPELVNDISMIRYRIVPDSLSAFGVEVEPAGRVPVSARLRQRPPDDKRVALCVVVGGGRDSEL
jgi:hypothetical protein